MSDIDYKQSLLAESALQASVKKESTQFTTKVKNQIGHLEAEYKKMRRLRRIGGGMLIAAFITFQVGDVIAEFVMEFNIPLLDMIIPVVAWLLLPLVGFLGVRGFQLAKKGKGVIQEFNTQFNALIFPEVFRIMQVSGQQIAVSDPEVATEDESKYSWLEYLTKKQFGDVRPVKEVAEHAQVLALLDHSELVTESRNRMQIDDMFHIDFNGRALFASELNINHVTGSGKNRKTKKIFKGYFVSFDLPRTLTGKTFVSTEGDKKGFGHMSFWKAKTGDNVRETALEWNQFEELLHVATNNESEARYVLPPDFMADLYDWWQSKQQNIRLSFIANRMYILFPDSDIRLKETVPSLDRAHIEAYILTIARPLMHVLHLVEDVSKAHRQ